MIAGPRVTKMIEGRTNNTRGITILMVVLAACSSARCRRSVRSESECTRSAWATLVPKRSVCIRVPTSDRMIVNSGALHQIAQSLGSRLAGSHLQVYQMELVAQFGMGVMQVLAHAHHGLIEGQSSFDADHGEIQGIGQTRA